jgi:hypothetical protein
VEQKNPGKLMPLIWKRGFAETDMGIHVFLSKDFFFSALSVIVNDVEFFFFRHKLCFWDDGPCFKYGRFRL